ncbi:MAG: hypothetical protein ABI960_10060, partial [Candidatus Eisenbacteria bacterium]
GYVMAALCACMPVQSEPTTTGDSDDSSTGGAATTSEDPTNVHETDPIQTVTSETDADPTTSSTGTSADDTTTTGAPDTGDVCPGLVNSVADMITGPRCELVLRFDTDSALQGWHVACGEVSQSATYDEKSALAATSCCGDGTFLNVPNGMGEIFSPFVVYLAPMDPTDGGVAVISNHLGAVVFDTSIGIDGPGTISVPKPLSPADGLVDPGDCSAAGFSFADLAVYHAGDGNNPIVVARADMHGSSLSLRQVEPYATEFRGLDEVGIDSLSAVRARAFLSENRALWPRLAGWKLARFFRVTGEAGKSPWRDPVFWSWGLLAPFALIGFARALTRPRSPAAVLALAVVAQTALAVVYWGSLRMRAPIEVVLIALGAGVVAALALRLRGAGGRPA